MVEITFVHDGAGKICLRRPKRTHTVVEKKPLTHMDCRKTDYIIATAYQIVSVSLCHTVSASV